jgi:hypothetical protein
VKVDVAKIYKRSAVQLLMFGYVRGAVEALPSISQKRAIEDFLVTFTIKEYNTESMLVEYNRMVTEFKTNA